MFKNYLTISFRNFWRHKLFSIINISGLSIGIAASLVIFMIVSYEFSFDKFEKDRERIYRVTSDLHFPDQLIQIAGVSMPLGPAVRRELPGIQEAASCLLYPERVHVTVAANNKPVVFKNQTNIVFADNSFFNIIPYKWTAGSPAVLNEPFHVVLAESRVKTYFPFKDIEKAIGQTIVYNDSMKATVSGIVKDINLPTDFTFKEFISYSTINNTGLKDKLNLEEWNSISSNTQLFLKATKGKDSAYINKQLKDLYDRHAQKDFLSITNGVQPLSDLHFNADYGNFSDRQANRSTLYGLMILALFLLALGCINFINLTTAQAGQRAKEIGIRKTMGSSRSQLTAQFLIETLLLTLFAAFIAISLVPLLINIFSGFIPPDINAGMLKQPNIILFSFALVISVNILAGAYPALFLSSYNPSVVLKNQAFTNTGKTRKAWLRKTLTVSQFVIAQFLVIAAIIVVKQINYSINKELGYKKDAIITFTIPGSPADGKKLVLQQKLNSIPGIEMVSLAGSTPAANGYNISTMSFLGDKKKIESTVEIKSADTNYFKVFGMKLLAGRYLQQSDTTKEFLINNTYAKFLGYSNPADIIGRYIVKDKATVPIVGVLADFHSGSTHSIIKPLAYSSEEKRHSNFHVVLKRVNGSAAAWKETIAKIEFAYKQVYPDEESFTYEFFDERIAKFYTTEQNLSKLLTWATALAIFISCLGLFGLVIYTTGVRTKEIGVRKVLGASVTQIVSLLSKEFVLLVLLAFLCAAPGAWWIMNKWLQKFAYRTGISWWVFILSGGLMIVIALITLSIQTIRSARANPVKSLRAE
jgi:ABC-type antimicrobial peptide transport system permease subunit